MGPFGASRRSRASGFPDHLHQFSRPGAERESPLDWPALIALKDDVSRELERLRAAVEIAGPRSRPK